MKLAIDCLTFESRKALGYERYIFSLLDCLYSNRAGVDADEVLIIVRSNQEAHFVQYADRMRIVTIDVRTLLGLALAQNTFRRRLRLSRDDVILHTYNYGSVIKQAKHVLVIFDLQYARLSKYWSRLKLWQRRLFVPQSIRVASKVVAISQFTKDEIIHFYHTDDAKIEVIYIPGDFQRLHSPAGTKGATVIGGEPSGGYFLSVSSMGPHKNLICLLTAYELLGDVRKGHELVLVGSRENLDIQCVEFLEHSEIGPYVLVTGDISDRALGALYKNCLAFILPTFYEGFGLPVAEALSYDRPVFLSDLSICREIAGTFGWYFRPDDFAELARLMGAVINEPEAFAVRSRDYVAERYSPENTTMRYVELVNHLLS